MPGLVLKQELMQELHVKTSLTAYETLQYLSVSDIYSDQTRAPSSLLSVIKIKIIWVLNFYLYETLNPFEISVKSLWNSPLGLPPAMVRTAV